MHNRVFDKLDMDYCYWPVEVAEQDLPTVFSGLLKMNVAGFNVTMPHKIRIMDLIDEIDPLANVIGAVNTVCIQDGRTKGYNTDGIGFVKSIEEEFEMSVVGKKVFLIGCGGAGRAISMTLATKGCKKIYLRSRRTLAVEALCRDINRRFDDCAAVAPSESEGTAEALRGCDILINAGSVGMHPHEDQMPIDAGLLFKDLIVADVVYNPRMTRLLETAKTTGCKIINGLGMLVYQGQESFRLWTGVTPPVGEMFDSVLNG
jgi:shikimate dehydrogenase